QKSGTQINLPGNAREKTLHRAEESREQSGGSLCEEPKSECKIECRPPNCRLWSLEPFPVRPGGEQKKEDQRHVRNSGARMNEHLEAGCKEDSRPHANASSVDACPENQGCYSRKRCENRRRK